MNRDTVREMAVQIVFGAPVSGVDSSVFLESFFSEEHFASLKEEGELYAEMPVKGMMKYIKSTVSGVFAHLEELDALIQTYAKGWSVSRISSTARAVLRVAVYEMLYADDVPVGAAINSAVEIDKGYDEPETVAFVNGVLGSVARAMKAGNVKPNSGCSEIRSSEIAGGIETVRFTEATESAGSAGNAEPAGTAL